jgi:hypothetical protein
MKLVTLIILACLVASMGFGMSTEQALKSYNSAFTVGAKGSGWMQVGFILPEYTVTEEVAGGNSYKKIVIPDAGTLLTSGMPDFPMITTSIAVPIHGNVSIEVISSQQHTVPGFTPYPVQQGDMLDSPKSFQLNNNYYTNGGNYPEAAIQYSDPMILRDFRIVTVQINPFSYNPQSGELTVHDNIQFRLNFNNEPGMNEMLTEPENISSAFAGIYESVILNFNDYRNRLISNSPPRILMIYGNNTSADYLNAINAFAHWKRQKGADVMMASTATAEAGSSTDSIRNYILAKYNNLATRPDFVVLIGDTSGSYTIPAYTVGGGGGDYPYTHLAGTDILGDCFIGRISAENLSELTTILTKIYLYERDINLATASWLNKMLLVGDYAPSGISTQYISKYIKELSLLTNPNYTFTEIYSDAPAPANINTAISQGIGFFSFRGYLNMSGWSPSSSLSNSFRLPHAVIITCSTGNYLGSTATTEAFIRLGSSGDPKGAVTAIGMSTSSTHTTFNNVLHGGIFDGVFVHDMRTMGEAMLHGKLYMNQIFGVSSPSSVQNFTHWCNLMGDPTMEVFTGIPNFFNIEAETTITLGLSLYDVSVLDGDSLPVSGAAVTLSMGNNILSRGFTGDDGNVILILPANMTVGDAILTVSTHNFKPKQLTIPVVDMATLVPATIVIDDDNDGASMGNLNGLAGSGETIEILFGIANTGTDSISGISGTISSESPYITIVDSDISYPAIPGGDFGFNTIPIIIQIAPNTPHDTMLRLHLNLTDADAITYDISEFIPVESAKMKYISNIVIDDNNQVLDPGEEAEFSVTVQNIGTSAISELSALIYTLNDMVAIIDNEAFFGDIPAGIQVTSGTNRFVVSARPEALPGMIIPLRMKLYNTFGFEQFIDFTLTLGQVSIHDPLGPDSYGYVIYDWLDIGYAEAPVYNWHEIAPAAGGLGTALPITDGYASGNEGDQVGANSLAVVNLPFPFQFYGRLYEQITVCSNGFIAMGVTANAEFRNFRLPGAMGPSPMIAAFWDDLATVSGSGIYTYYNINNQTFTIEWYNMRNGAGTGTSPETFQIILHNQTVYPTSFGDGPIKIQYHTFNNVDSQTGNRHGNYCTIGIEDHTGRMGLEYSFNNLYPTAAAPLSNRKAIYITNAPTYHLASHLIIDGTYISDANGNGICEPGEEVSLGVSIQNSGNVVAGEVNATLSTTSPYVTINLTDSSYFPVLPGTSEVNRYPFKFSVIPSCPDGEVINFTLHITSGDNEWTRFFSFQVEASNLKYHSYMVDDHEGNFNGIIDTGESVNVIVNLQNESVVAASNVTVNLSSANSQVLILNPQISRNSITPNDILQLSFSIDTSAVAATETMLPFQLSINMANANPIITDFQIPYNNPNIALDFDLNSGHFVSETGWAWGTPTQFTPHSGQKLWATNLSGNYPNLVQYNLYTPMYLLTTGSVISFWHRYAFENNYDGANVSISTDGGESWIIIQPNGGYNSTGLNGLNGEVGWTGISGAWLNPSFNLTQYAGQAVMFRFRFGSDAATSNTGWFIDDFMLSGVNQKQGYLYGVVYPTSGISPIYSRVSSNLRYTTNPDAEGNFKLYLPNGTHNIVASIAHHQSSALNDLHINPETPVHYTEFTLIDLPQPFSLSFSVNNDNGLLNINWMAPFDPVLPVLGYNVYRKFDTGPFHLVSTVEETSYSETLSYEGAYQYYVSVQYLNAEGSPSDLLSFLYPYVSNPQDAIPALVTKLDSNYPNPFNPSTTISFSLAKAGKASLAIYNLKGQLVKRLVDGDYGSGEHKVVWNGKDENNRNIASGMYFYRMESGSYKSVKKMLLMK